MGLRLVFLNCRQPNSAFCDAKVHRQWLMITQGNALAKEKTHFGWDVLRKKCFFWEGEIVVRIKDRTLTMNKGAVLSPSLPRSRSSSDIGRNATADALGTSAANLHKKDGQ